MTKVKVLKPHMGPTGFVQVGGEIEVDEHRHRALARNGIVPPIDGEEPPAKKVHGVKHAITNADFQPRRSEIVAPSRVEPPAAKAPPEPAGYETKTVPELKELAEVRGVDLGDATKKADIIAALELSDEESANEADSEEAV